MNILVGCEYSRIVASAFEAKGHYVLSADLLNAESPGNHYPGDIFDLINYSWDMAIFFHPALIYVMHNYGCAKEALSAQNSKIKLFNL